MIRANSLGFLFGRDQKVRFSYAVECKIWDELDPRKQPIKHKTSVY